MDSYPGWNEKTDLYWGSTLLSSQTYGRSAPDLILKMINGELVLTLKNTGDLQTYTYYTSPSLGATAQWTQRGTISVDRGVTNAFGPMVPKNFIMIR